MTGANRDEAQAVKRTLLKARFKALLRVASPEILQGLEQAIGRAEEQARPRKPRGRPERLRSTYRELLLNATLQKLLYGLRDKEAVESLVWVARPQASGEERRQLVKQWRMRLSAAKKK